MIAVFRRVYKLILANGSCPIDEFLSDVKVSSTRARIVRRIDKVERGNFGDCREFDVIGELKIDLGPGYRVYYCKQGNVIVILLGGGDKKSQQADIEQAKKCWEAWKRQSAAGVDLPSWLGTDEDTEGKQ